MVIKLKTYPHSTQVINAKHIISLDYENQSGRRTETDGYYLYESYENKHIVTITMVNGKEYTETFQDENTAKIFYNTALSEMGEKEFRLNLKKE